VPSPLVHRQSGYVLTISPQAVDVHRFRALVEQVGHGGLAANGRVAALRQALDMWRGVPLADVSGFWAARTREGLVRLQLSAATQWAQLELERNNPAAVIDELYRMLEEHPLEETLAAVLIRALHADGRPSEGLRYYSRAVQRLTDELNTGPGAALRAAGEAVLRPLVPPAAA
jgi:DNA-binding SARP family transcriptional activator